MAGREVSAAAVLLLIQIIVGSWGQVMIDEDIDDTSDMDGGYITERRTNGHDWGNGRRNDLYPDDRGRSEFFHKSPYDDDDLDHRGHENSEAYHRDSSCRLGLSLWLHGLSLILLFKCFS